MAILVYGNMYSIPASSKKADLSAQFIEFMAGEGTPDLHHEITGTFQSPHLGFHQSDLWLSTQKEAQWRNGSLVRYEYGHRLLAWFVVHWLRTLYLQRSPRLMY